MTINFNIIKSSKSITTKDKKLITLSCITNKSAIDQLYLFSIHIVSANNMNISSANRRGSRNGIFSFCTKPFNSRRRRNCNSCSEDVITIMALVDDDLIINDLIVELFLIASYHSLGDLVHQQWRDCAQCSINNNYSPVFAPHPTKQFAILFCFAQNTFHFWQVPLPFMYTVCAVCIMNWIRNS